MRPLELLGFLGNAILGREWLKVMHVKILLIVYDSNVITPAQSTKKALIDFGHGAELRGSTNNVLILIYDKTRVIMFSK